MYLFYQPIFIQLRVSVNINGSQESTDNCSFTLMSIAHPLSTERSPLFSTLNLLDRALEILLGPYDIPHNAENHDRSPYEDTPICVLGGRGGRLWPKRPEQKEDAVQASDNIVEYA